MVSARRIAGHWLLVIAAWGLLTQPLGAQEPKPGAAGTQGKSAQQQKTRPARATTPVAATVRSPVVQAKAQDRPKQPTDDDERDGIIVRALKFFDRHNGAFNALAALAVAFFTWRLWRLSRKEIDALGQQSDDVKASIAESARAATAMEDVATAMKASAKAAQATIEGNREAMVVGLRAYLTVIEIQVIYDANVPVRVKSKIWNSGRTPARSAITWSAAVLGPIPAVDEIFISPAKGAEVDFGVSIIPPDSGVDLDCVFTEFSATELDAWHKGERAVYAWGEINYVDWFGNARRTTYRMFGLRASTHTGALAICNQGNEAT